MSYEVAEAELTAAGNGTVEVAHAKLGIGGYWLELAGRVGLVVKGWGPASVFVQFHCEICP